MSRKERREDEARSLGGKRNDKGEERPMKPKLVHLLIALALFAFAQPSFAHVVLSDHIDCYKVSVVRGQFVVNTHAGDSLTILPSQVPPFKVADGCKIVPRPLLFCIPVGKEPSQAPFGTKLDNDYLVYKLKCPQKLPSFNQGVQDQFSKGVLTVRGGPVLIEVPAYKTDTPPIPGCDRIAVDLCGGTCQTPGDVCALRTNTAGVVTCGCAPPPTPCGLIPGTNQCGGDCPTGMTCKGGVTAPCACG